MSEICEADVVAKLGRVDALIVRELFRTKASSSEFQRAAEWARSPSAADHTAYRALPARMQRLVDLSVGRAGRGSSSSRVAMRTLRHSSESCGMRERRLESFAASREDGFRFRTAVLWAVAGFIVFGSHVACALVLFNWPAPAVTVAEPPAAIMIDLPPNAPALGAQSQSLRATDQAVGDDDATASDAVQTAFAALTTAPGQADDAHQFGSLIPQPAFVAPIASWPAPAAARRPKPKKTARRAVKPVRHIAAAPLPVVASVQEAEAETGNAAPAARIPTAMAGASATAAEVPSSWKSRLLAQLERYKRYPDAAHDRREEGTTLLSFTIDREGHVLDSFIARSSGFASLDDEALSMLLQAQPLPEVPPEVPGETLQLAVPIHFSVN